MAATTCWLTDEAKAAITEWEHDGAATSALVLKCSTKMQEIQVEELLRDLTPEELGEELEETSPRLILYRYPLTIDAAHAPHCPMFIFYNPGDVRVDIKQTYEKSREQVVNHITQVHCKAFQVTNLKNFRESYIRAMALGVTGDADVALDPRFEVHGREAVTM